MSALAEALVAAQARAVAALGKQYVGGAVGEGYVRERFEQVGLTDEVDTARLLAAWATGFGGVVAGQLVHVFGEIVREHLRMRQFVRLSNERMVQQAERYANQGDDV